MCDAPFELLLRRRVLQQVCRDAVDEATAPRGVGGVDDLHPAPLGRAELPPLHVLLGELRLLPAERVEQRRARRLLLLKGRLQPRLILFNLRAVDGQLGGLLLRRAVAAALLAQLAAEQLHLLPQPRHLRHGLVLDGAQLDRLCTVGVLQRVDRLVELPRVGRD
eukprot:1047594-Prymnesium_polylepis.1